MRPHVAVGDRADQILALPYDVLFTPAPSALCWGVWGGVGRFCRGVQVAWDGLVGVYRE